nr:MAG TPA: hypothetical protein [Caudoviricetes sp.]
MPISQGYRWKYEHLAKSGFMRCGRTFDFRSWLQVRRFYI